MITDWELPEFDLGEVPDIDLGTIPDIDFSLPEFDLMAFDTDREQAPATGITLIQERKL